MSDFSNVDASPRVDRLISYLQTTDTGLAAMKAYMAWAAKRAVSEGLVVDLGCGIGTDLVRLESTGLAAIGLDSSMQMLRRAAAIADPLRLAQADVAAIPLRSASVDAVRVERVLQHVAEPREVVAEIARVVRPGGALFVFEPDYDTMRVDSDVVADGSWPAAMLRVRHPRIGSEMLQLFELAGFRTDDVVTESSRGYSFSGLPVDAPMTLARAVADGRCEQATVTAWLDEQRSRTEDGTFRGRWDKVLLVATRREGR